MIAARDLAQRRAVTTATEVGLRPTPFDYAFRFDLVGQPGKVANQIVTISVEASFTAVSIGYGVIPKVQPIIFGPPPPPLVIGRGVPSVSLGSITLQSIIAALDQQLRATSQALSGETGPEAVFRNGIKLNPDVVEFALQDRGNKALNPDILGRLFQVVGSPSDLIQFKYALFDEASGREFQSEPILNIAGLGSANGERPFRYFAQPIVFRPRSTIRMEITEVSDFKGELNVALHGYKVLGEPNSPTAVTRRTRRR
ncbi:MAG TPA: hypothetical protein VIG25_04840 [Pyrinomonadaceae bacterium]